MVLLFVPRGQMRKVSELATMSPVPLIRGLPIYGFI